MRPAENIAPIGVISLQHLIQWNWNSLSFGIKNDTYLRTYLAIRHSWWEKLLSRNWIRPLPNTEWGCTTPNWCTGTEINPIGSKWLMIECVHVRDDRYRIIAIFERKKGEQRILEHVPVSLVLKAHVHLLIMHLHEKGNNLSAYR